MGKARMMLMLVWTAISDLSSPDIMAMPSRVNANGRYLLCWPLPTFKVKNLQLKASFSHWDRYLGMMTAMTQVPVPSMTMTFYDYDFLGNASLADISTDSIPFSSAWRSLFWIGSNSKLNNANDAICLVCCLVLNFVYFNNCKIVSGETCIFVTAHMPTPISFTLAPSK